MANSDVSVGVNGSHDLILKDRPTGGNVTVGLEVARDPRTGLKRWFPKTLPGRANRISTGPLSFSDINPALSLIHSQNDWSGGALQAVYDPRYPNRYAQANGMDARARNVFAPGMKREGPVDFIIRNGGAEYGDTTGWTAGTGVTISAVAAAARSGSYGFRIVTDGARTNGHDLMFQDLANGFVYRGRTITVHARLRRVSGPTSSIRLFIQDSSATSASSSVSQGEFTHVKVTRTISATATFVRVGVELVSNEAGAHTFDVDDIAIIPAGGVTCHGITSGPENLIPNGEGEIDYTAHWIPERTFVTVTQVIDGQFNGKSHSGRGAFSLNWSGEVSHSAGDQRVARYELPNPEAYRGKTITFTCYTSDPGGSDREGIRIVDDAGTSEAFVNETEGEYVPLTVTRTIAPDATFVHFKIFWRAANSGLSGGRTFFDQLRAYVVPRVHHLYGIFGRCVCMWDEGAQVWNAVFIHASAEATSIVTYNDVNVVAFGGGDNAYIVGAGTGWYASTLEGDAKYAHFLTISRNTLWKTRFDGTTGRHIYVASSTNPEDNGSWSGEDAVGTPDRQITGLFGVNDTLLVGKEDGLHAFLRTYPDGSPAAVWQNITQQYAVNVSTENFARGREFNNYIYLTASQQGFLRWPGAGPIENLTNLLTDPRQRDFGGRVRAFANDTVQLWLLADTPTSDESAEKEIWLMSFTEDTEGLHLHTMEKVSIGDINVLEVHNGYLWAFGRLFDEDAGDYKAAIHRWVLPSKTIAPFTDANPQLTSPARIEMPRFDGGLPTEEKAYIKMTVFLDDSVLDAEHTLTVKYRLDEGEEITLGTFNESTGENHKVLYFENVADPHLHTVGRSIQPIFEATTNDGVPVQVWGYKIEATYQPPAQEAVEVHVRIGDHLTRPDGGTDPDSKADKVAALRALMRQAYPIYWAYDIDRTGTPEERRGHIKRDSLRRVREMETEPDVEIWGFELVEVEVAAP